MSARDKVAAVVDPELPMLTLDDLGVIRDVREDRGEVVVTITPTYSGCPAMDEIRADLRRALQGYDKVEVRTVLSPAWTTDWISEAGKAKLAAAGISPPGPAPRRAPGPVRLSLRPTRTRIACPQCGHPESELISAFSATACRELRRCPSCREPFEHVKEI